MKRHWKDRIYQTVPEPEKGHHCIGCEHDNQATCYLFVPELSKLVKRDLPCTGVIWKRIA